MAKVYIPQEPMRFDRDRKEWYPIIDLTPARVYGELEVLLSHNATALTIAPMIFTLRKKLKDFCDDDFIVAVGNPTVLMWTGIIAAEMNRGRVQTLVWDGASKNYVSVKGASRDGAFRKERTDEHDIHRKAGA